MNAKKISRKELKEPDEFVAFWDRAIGYLISHKRESLQVVTGLLVAVLVISMAILYFQKREKTASRLLGQAQTLLSPARAAGVAEAIKVDTSAESEEAKQGFELLKSLVEDYGGTHSGQKGRILLGDIYYEKGELDAAVDTYRGFLKGRGQPAILTALAWDGLAHTHEAKGDFGEALECYEELSRMDLTYMQGWALIGVARCNEKLDKPEAALEAYRTLLASDPQHARVDIAKAGIARLAPGTSGDGSD